MRRQRGGILLYLAAAIAILALISGIVFGVTHYLSGVRAEAFAAGKDTCDAAYKGRDNTQLQTALARVKTLEDEARVAEYDYNKRVAAIQRQLEREKANGKAAEDRILADVAAGKYRVRGDAFQAGGCPAISGGSQGRPVSAGAAGSDGAAACKLSAEAERSVLDIGRDANETARILAAAQAIIAEDRRLCGQP